VVFKLAIVEVSVVHDAGFGFLILTKQQYLGDDV
jgi:hypothetical protein